MTKESSEKTASSLSQQTGGTHIEGDFQAGRDMILGDQYNYNYQPQQIANISTPVDFVAELQKLKDQLAMLQTQPALPSAQVQTLEVVEGQVSEVIEEAQKPQPLGARIVATLTGTKAILDSLSGTITSAAGMGAALAGLAQVALKLFGG